MRNHDADALLNAEYGALKAEMMLRIAIQNLTILGTVGVFSSTAILTTLVPEQAGRLALLQSLATLALALQWCHQGVRQCALKQAILDRDACAGRLDGWENWLPGARPTGPLGSRWFVSTKAVFIGLTVASIGFSAQDFGPSAWGAVVTLIMITTVLLTNPRE